MNRKIKIISILVAIVLTLSAYKVFQPKNKEMKTNDKGKGGSSTVKVLVIKPHSSSETIILPGNVIANNELDIKSEISGKIAAVYFEEGQKVSQNQLLIKISDADLQASLNKLQIQKKYLEDKEKRAGELLKSGNTSQESYDVSQNSLDIVKADIAILQLQIAKTEIRAPFAGTAGFKNISPGSFVSAGSLLLNFYQNDLLKIEFSIPEKYASIIKPNSEIKFKIDGSDVANTAKISAIAPKVNQLTRTVPVRALYANKNGKVLPGNFANVEIGLNTINNAILIPADALLKSAEGEKVFVFSAGKAQQKFVKTGLRTQKEIMITEGLQAGDSLIVSGAFQLKDGAKVRLAKDKDKGKGKK